MSAAHLMDLKWIEEASVLQWWWSMSNARKA
jgi:hypothetical protein